MISVVIEMRQGEDEALARTLASLVPAAVEGAVREVLVCDPGADAAIGRVAEQAGCHYFAGAGAGEGARQARSEWLLLLEPGARLVDGWTEIVREYVNSSTGAARFAPSKQGRLPLLQRLLSRRRKIAYGLVIMKREALSLAGGGGSADGIAGAARARCLAAEIVMALSGRARDARPDR